MSIQAFLKLGRDERGASIIEMALAAPLLATLLIGMTDIARAYSTKLMLEQAAQRAIEQVMQQKSVSTDYSTIGAEAQAAATAAGLGASTAAVDYWLECVPPGQTTGTRQGDGTAGNGFTGSCSDSTHSSVRYVTVSVSSRFSPMFGTRFFPGANADKTVTVTGKAGVRVQ